MYPFVTNTATLPSIGDGVNGGGLKEANEEHHHFFGAYAVVACAEFAPNLPLPFVKRSL